jgi:hypothetical protein
MLTYRTAEIRKYQVLPASARGKKIIKRKLLLKELTASEV